MEYKKNFTNWDLIYTFISGMFLSVTIMLLEVLYHHSSLIIASLTFVTSLFFVLYITFIGGKY